MKSYSSNIISLLKKITDQRDYIDIETTEYSHELNCLISNDRIKDVGLFSQFMKYIDYFKAENEPLKILFLIILLNQERYFESYKRVFVSSSDLIMFFLCFPQLFSSKTISFLKERLKSTLFISF